MLCSLEIECFSHQGLKDGLFRQTYEHGAQCKDAKMRIEAKTERPIKVKRDNESLRERCTAVRLSPIAVVIGKGTQTRLSQSKIKNTAAHLQMCKQKNEGKQKQRETEIGS